MADHKKSAQQLQTQVKALQQRIVDLEAVIQGAGNGKKNSDFELFQTVVEQVDAAVVIIQDGKIVYANPFVEKTLGYTVAEALGTPFLDYIHPDEKEEAAQVYLRRMKGKQPMERYERTLLHKNGSKVIAEISGKVVAFQGKPSNMATLNDITERKRNEQKLLENEKLLKSIISNYPAYFSIIEKDFTVGFTSGREFARQNLNPDDYFGLTVDDIFEEHAPFVKEKYVKAFAGEEVTFELFINNQYQLYHVIPLKNETGEIEKLMAVVENITDRKIAEKELQASEEKYRFLAENTADIVWISDTNFKTTYVSPSIEKVLGFTPEERMNQPLEEMMTPESLQRVMAKYAEELRREQQNNGNSDRLIRIEVEYYHKNGSTVWMENTVKVIKNENGEIVGIAGSTRDISERKRAEMILQENEVKYRTLVEHSIQGVVIARANPVRLSFASIPMERICGYSPEELTKFKPDQIVRLIHPDDRERFFGNFQKRIEGENIPRQDQYRIIHKNGKTRWVEIYSSRIKYQDEAATQTVFLDITDRKRAEEELQKSEEKYRRIVDTANEGIWMMDENYCTTYVNEKMASTLGYTVEEMVGKPIRPFIFQDDLPSQEKTLKRREKGEADQYERRFLHKDGNVRWLLVSATALQDENGKFAGSFAMFTDITDRKNAENALKESEVRYRTLFESAHDAIFVADPETGILLDMNAQAEKLTGYTREELIGRHQSFLHPSENKKRYKRGFRDALEKKGSLFSEIEILTKHGKRIPVEVSSGGKVKIGNQNIHIGIFRDITERKRAEQEIRESEHRFRSLYENTTIGLYRTTPDGKIVMANPTIVKMLGFDTKEDLDKRNLSHEGFARQNDRDIFTRCIEEKGEVHGFESVWTTKTGDKIYVRESARAFRDENGKIMYYEGTVEDISERKKAEVALVQSENKFRTLFNEAPVGYHEIDAKGRIRQINKTELEMLGYSRNEMVGRFIWEFIADAGCKQSVLKKLKGQTEPGKGYERRFIRKNGSTFIALIEDRLLKDTQGKIDGISTTIQDISQLIEIQEKLQAHLTFFETLIDTMPNPVFYKDKSGKYKGCNRAFASEILGMEKNKIIGKAIFDLPDTIPDDLAKVYHEKDLELLENPGNQFYEAEVQCADGVRRDYVFTKATYNDLQGNIAGMVGVMVDITERKRLEEQLRQSLKMEAIGRLAGGIAHDFNNLLTAILGNSEFALFRLSENNPMREELNEIRKAGNRAAALTQQLLAFSRRQPLKRKVTNLNHVVNNIKKMIQRIIGEDIKLTTELGGTLGSCYVDPSQIEQVIMNLAVNARDAMPNGGELLIKTENVKIEAGEGKESSDGKAVCMLVQDSGSGIDPETLKKIFDPFFSTKGPGGGTGLGLSVVHGIVEQHDGWLTVDSKIGKGTRFRVFFPSVSDVIEVEKVETLHMKAFRGNRERILLVEDEEDVRKFISKILRWYNYIVIGAENATEAMAKFDAEDGNFDLVLSDVVLPDQNGYDLVRKMMKKEPGLRVLLSSGYMDEKVGREKIEAQDIPFLQKPYDLHELLKSIQKVLKND